VGPYLPTSVRCLLLSTTCLSTMVWVCWACLREAATLCFLHLLLYPCLFSPYYTCSAVWNLQVASACCTWFTRCRAVPFLCLLLPPFSVRNRSCTRAMCLHCCWSLRNGLCRPDSAPAFPAVLFVPVYCACRGVLLEEGREEEPQSLLMEHVFQCVSRLPAFCLLPRPCVLMLCMGVSVLSEWSHQPWGCCLHTACLHTPAHPPVGILLPLPRPYLEFPMQSCLPAHLPACTLPGLPCQMPCLYSPSVAYGPWALGWGGRTFLHFCCAGQFSPVLPWELDYSIHLCLITGRYPGLWR